MLSDILLGGALLVLRWTAPVAAWPQFLGRDEYYTATVTVCPSTAGSSLPSLSAPSSSPQTVTVSSTVTIVSTIDSDPAPQAAALFPTDGASIASGPKIVTEHLTKTITSTVYASSGPGGQQITDSANPGAPQAETVTAPSILTSVEIQTVTQTQTVTLTPAPANNIQTGLHGPLDGEPDGASVTFYTVTSMRTTTLTISTPSTDLGLFDVHPGTTPGAAVPPQPTPHFSNSTHTGQFRTSSGSSTRDFIQSGTALAPSSSATVPLASNSSTTGYENGVYFANWGIYGADFQPQSLPVSALTRVFYAFADIGSDGTVQSSDTYADITKHYPTDSWDDANATSNVYGCVKQLFLLKKANRNLKVLLSIGGWTFSYKFAPVAADATARARFVASAVALITDYGFDGIDIDWEFNAYKPGPADAANLALLLQQLRAGLDGWAARYAPPGQRLLLTVASPAGPATYGQWDLAAMDAAVDAWNLMAYDYAGAWGTASGHAANVFPAPDNPAATPFNTAQAVAAYTGGAAGGAAGIAPAKLMLGLPLYGRSFDGTAALGRAFAGVGGGDGLLGAGQWRYRGLPRAGAAERFDADALAAYSYDDATAELISYDNVRSTTAKSQYLAAAGLGGAYFWEASDDKNGSDSLVATMAALLAPLASVPNLLSYPTSKYANIRNGMP